MKVVCDTNVLIAALAANGLCRDIVKRRLPRLDLVTSKGLLVELEETVRRTRCSVINWASYMGEAPDAEAGGLAHFGVQVGDKEKKAQLYLARSGACVCARGIPGHC